MIVNKNTLQMKVNNTQLKKELKTLEKAEEIRIRSHHTDELQFRRKYEKYLTRGNFETSLLKKDNFRNVAKQDKIFNVQSQEVVPLHKLIYTNGEVDVDKVICLHLLSVQHLDITSFSGKKNMQLFPKRSKPNLLEASALPFYIVEIIYKVEKELKLDLEEGQDVIMLVNSNLEKLIISILEVLAIISPFKLEKIKKLSQNKKAIQEMMTKTKISNFLAQITDNPVLFKMANYHLEIAQYQEEPSSLPNVLSVSCINLKDKSNKLEQVQADIKKAIADYTQEDITSGESWAMFHKRLCSCRKASSRPSITSGNAIALLSDDGRGFAVVTGSGCHLPASSSIFCPSLTAIIKSSQHPQSFSFTEERSGYSLHAKASPYLRNEHSSLISSLLQKVSNSHRLLIAKKAAEYKSQKNIRKFGKQKIPINKVIEDVFSKQSLISFASSRGNEELRLLFQPCCKGGLGIGQYILEPEKQLKNNKRWPEKTLSTRDYESGVIPQMLQQEKSIMHTAHIKQEIFTSETRNKMKQFLLSDNPGYKKIV